MASTNITITGATGTNTVTPPAHQAKDVFILFAFRDGSNTAPTVPSGQGWQTLSAAAGGNTCSSILVGKECTSSSEGVGTFTNASACILLRLRGADWNNIVGAVADTGNTTSSVDYPALGTFTRTDGSSLGLFFSGHRNVNTSLESPPSGTTFIIGQVDATCEVAAFKSTAGISSWSQQSVAVGGSAGGWRAKSMEALSAFGAVIVQTKSACTQSVTATVPGNVTGTVAQSIHAASNAAVAKQIEKGVVAQSIGACTQSVAAKQIQHATVTQSIGAPSNAAAATIKFIGATVQSIGAPSNAIAAKQTQYSSVTQSIGAPFNTAAATAGYAAAVLQSIGASTHAIAAHQANYSVVTQSIGAPFNSILAEYPTGFDIAINFRGTDDYVVDGPGQTYCLGENYPVGRGGGTFGFLSGPGDRARDRDDTNIPELAGQNQISNNGTLGIFQFDLETTGPHEVHLAIGDATSSQAYQKVVVKDDTDVITTIEKTSGLTANVFADATGAEYSHTDWESSETPIEYDFQSTTLILELGTTALDKTHSTTIAHLRVVKVEDDGSRTAVISQTISSPSNAITALAGYSSTITQSLSAPSNSVAVKQIQHATVTQSIGAPTQSVTAKHPYSSVVSQTLSACSQAVTASQINHATAAQSIGAPVNAIVATHPYTAAIAQSIGAPFNELVTIVATGEDATAEIAQAIGAPFNTIAAKGVFHSSVTQSIGAPTNAASAKVSNVATVIESIGAATQAVTALLQNSATIASSIGAPINAVAAHQRNLSAVTQSIGAPHNSVTAAIKVDASVNQTLSASSQAVAAKLVNSAAIAQSISAPSQSVTARRQFSAAVVQSIGVSTNAVTVLIHSRAHITQGIGAPFNTISAEIGIIPASPYFVYTIERSNLISVNPASNVIKLEHSNVITVDRNRS